MIKVDGETTELNGTILELQTEALYAFIQVRDQSGIPHDEFLNSFLKGIQVYDLINSGMPYEKAKEVVLNA